MTNELLQLDREWLTNLCSNGVSFHRELLKIFHEQGDAYLHLLTSCNTLGGHPELSDQTHRLKGSASSLGLRKLAALTSEFEKALREGKEAEAQLKEKAAAMEKEIKAGEQAVEQYIAEIENTK